MKKNRIRLTESQLHNVIKESVKNILINEGDWSKGSDMELDDIRKSLLNFIMTNTYHKSSDPQGKEIGTTLIEAARLIDKAIYLINKRGVVANVVY